MSLQNAKTEKLQEAMSYKHLPCIPGPHTKEIVKPSYHRAQRFKATHDGRMFEYQFTQAVDPDMRHESKLKETKHINEEKLRILRDWSDIREKERLSEAKERERECKQKERTFDLDSVNVKVDPNLRKPPSWLANQGCVLQFDGYFVEPISQPALEEFRTREFKIYYFLADNSVQITEPKQQNSGLPQGLFRKRAPVDLEPEQLCVGNEVDFCGRTFKITGCDAFTKNYLKLNTARMCRAEKPPMDSFHQRKDYLRLLEKENKSKIAQTKPPKESVKMKKFLRNEGNVLRFYCIWDDTSKLYGLKRKFVLNYYLADDTIEVRGPKKLMLNKQRLEKPDSEEKEQFYGIEDLKCGNTVTCFGRHLFLYDCDGFTKQYYKSEYSVDQLPVNVADEFEEGKQFSKRRFTPPPYNGFGSEEDSLANCLHLIPKQSTGDFKKFLKQTGQTLTYIAVLNEKDKNNSQCLTSKDFQRKFVVTWFMDDSTVAVFEPARHNSGVMGGQYLQRGKYMIPCGKRNKRNQWSPELLKLQHYVQGKINSRLVGGPFGLLRAFRQFAVNENCMIDFEGFKIGLSSVGVVQGTIEEDKLRELFSLYDKTGDNSIDFQEFVDNVMGDTYTSVNDSEYISRQMVKEDLYEGARIRFFFSRSGVCSDEFIILRPSSATRKFIQQNPDMFDKSDTNFEQTPISEVQQRSVHSDQVIESSLQKYKEIVNLVSIERIVKKFSSSFFRIRELLKKNFLKYDIYHTNLINCTNFQESLRETNLDFEISKEAKLLINYLFQQRKKIDYIHLMDTFFSQDISEIEKVYGTFKQ
eukprot:maker-scaffold_1-snap-gene-30.60-mRNA-1 protein AED:0.20 eAED:0.20 QI:0/0/0/1/1/1/2/0/807